MPLESKNRQPARDLRNTRYPRPLLLPRRQFWPLGAARAQSKISQDKAASKREERLLMSSVYELGMDIIERQLKSSVRGTFGVAPLVSLDWRSPSGHNVCP